MNSTLAKPFCLHHHLTSFVHAVAYGVIAGLVSYLAIHAPFWITDYIRKRFWPSSNIGSPRSSRAMRRWVETFCIWHLLIWS